MHTLTNSDGSATYGAPNQGYQITAGVNYPVEVPFRSDEIPESTLIEVNVRPHNGVSMVKERHVENLVKRTLRTVVLGEQTPRTMLQISLQVISVETDDDLPGGVKSGGQSETYLDLLASTLNAAILACLDAGVQMETLIGAALVGLDADSDQVFVHPGIRQRKQCSSLHVLAFSNDGKAWLMESQGRFSMDHFKQAEQAARLAIIGHLSNTADQHLANKQDDGDAAMNGIGDSSAVSVLDVMRRALHERVIKDERWRQA
jgi:exosome complex component RRP46